MSVLQTKHNDIKLFESEKCVDKEYTVAHREVSRLPQNFVQYWVNTGYLPFQYLKDNAVHSDTGSSLSERESLYKHSAVCNTTFKHKLNEKKLCNDGSSNSSVDTVAYVLSNTNIKRRENKYSRFYRKDGILKSHNNRNYKNNKIDTPVNINSSVDCNISTEKCAFDTYSKNNMYQKDRNSEETTMIEEVELKLSPSYEEDNVEVCKTDKQVNEDDLNCQNKEFLKNSLQEIINTTNSNENNSVVKDSCNDSTRPFRQKKLYIGRESPIDINMSIESNSMSTDISEKIRISHPAYRNSPLLHKSHKKFMPKKRKYKFFFKNSRNKSQEDTSSNNSASDNIDVETHHAKRRKSLENSESHVHETQLFSTLSQTSEKDKLRQSCKEMEKQIKRFITSEFIHMNKLKEVNCDHLTQGNVKSKKSNSRYRYAFKSKTNVQEKVTQEDSKETVSHSRLNKMHNPIVLLERLSETIIQQYTNKRDLQSKETRKNKNTTKHSPKLKNMKLNSQLENVIVDSENSNASTMIIYDHTNSQSLNCYKALSRDIKLIQMRPVVVLERLHNVVSFKKKHLSKLNNLGNNLQPIVVLTPLGNIKKNVNCNINSLVCDDLNKSNARIIKRRETNKKMDRNSEDSKKLLYFRTNMNSDSDSDSDASLTNSIFNSNTHIKHNVKENKIINQKSFNSTKNGTQMDLGSIEGDKINFSKTFTTKSMSLDDSIACMSTSTEYSFFGKQFCVNKVDSTLNNLNKSNNNHKVYSFSNIQPISSFEKDNGIRRNSVRSTVTTDSNINNKRNKLVFVTRANDSDSD